MEEAEPPECPVCLQPYDAVSAIPRVLTCGHTTCEACLKQLPNPFPNTIRCTVCTLLVKFLNCPSSLPKNLDLLHFSSALQNRHRTKEKIVNSPSPHPPETKHFPPTVNSWSYELYRKWKKWILPEDCISIVEFGSESDGGGVCGTILKYFESDRVIGCVLKEEETVSLFKIGVFVEDQANSKYFNSSYESRIVAVLCRMKEEEKTQLEVILCASLRVNNVGKAYGFWYNEDNKCVYIVFEKFKSPNLKCVLKQKESGEGDLSTDEIRGTAMLGLAACEILSRLNSEGLAIGFLSVSSFGFDDFGRVYIDLSEILNTGRRLSMAVRRGFKDLEVDLFREDYVFISPEMLLHFLVKDGFDLDLGKSRYEVGSASDVWSLACLLVRLIVGKSFLEEIEPFLNFVVNGTKDKTGCDYSGLYTSWMDKISALLECRLSSEFAYLNEILRRCLSFDPKDRPVITDLWRCLRELVIKPQFDTGLVLKQDVKKEKSGQSVVLGELCYIVEKTDINKEVGADVEPSVDGDVAESMSIGQVKCTEMKGHLDCITGLAIGGGFLFSSSYDKIVRVWSLQDLTHVHSFKGHEHRITALVFVDGAQQLCVSGDSEGVICIWEANPPFSELPLKKLYEGKDWRYSGIHTMAVSETTQYLYTGGGDKLVKAWSLQDYTISCSMSGHKSVVSSLVVSEGVLFSGSWDGTVRLWSLVDHSPVAVLGQDVLGNIASVSSICADRHLLFVGHENGSIKIWHNDVLLKSIETHKGAVFSICKKGKWLFSGGWDKTISVQEISEDVLEMEATPIGSIACNSTITALAYWNGKIFVGQADRIIKVYHGM
ncbi:hypothetical protein ABFS83_03G102400 [Erythranthe nasuta]